MFEMSSGDGNPPRRTGPVRSPAILRSTTHHQLTSAKLIRAIFRIQHHQLIVQHRIGVEASTQRSRDGFRAGLLDAAGGHTAMLALDDDCYVLRFGDFLQNLRDVAAYPFLSCSCSLRPAISAIRAILLKPMTFCLGIYATATFMLYINAR